MGMMGWAQETLQPAQVEHPAVHTHRPHVPRSTSTQSEQLPATALPSFCAPCVRENLSYLAGPGLHGRGSGTEDEHHAAEFIASKLKQNGLQPAADDGYIQTVTIESRKVIGIATLSVGGNTHTGATVWAHGKDIVFLRLTDAEATGTLQKVDLNQTSATATAVRDGAAIAVKLKSGTTVEAVNSAVAPFRSSRPSIIMIASSPELLGLYHSLAHHPPRIPKKIGDDSPAPSPVIVLVSAPAFEQMWTLPDGTPVRVQAQLTPWEQTHTWNVLAKVPGQQEDQVILLSAHLDHLGVLNGKMYPGADDDASGTVAVMELARILANARPQRTVVVALWGSEEAGLIGSRYFLQHPTFPLENIVANLEFEMIARADPAVKPQQLWLTGYNRSDLGPQLAAHGADLVADPHPSQNFFARSDNYALAQKGIVAQTISSFGLHKDYHQPGDTLGKINWQHLDAAIQSMIEPLTWLSNTDFRPQWNQGENPKAQAGQD
jgi:Zn-dependent M28 family amino/carboxypeptidase